MGEGPGGCLRGFGGARGPSTLKKRPLLDENAFFFPVQESTAEQARSSSEGLPKSFREGVFSDAFSYLHAFALTKQIPSHALLQTGTNQWRQLYYKEDALVELL